MRTFGWAAVVLAVGILTLSEGAWLRAQPHSAKPVNVDGKVFRNAGTANDALPGSWLTNGRTQAETRYTTLKQINDTNAKRLGLAWSYVVGAGGGNQEGTPLMWNNTLYGITTWSVVYALDARTGKELWRWDPVNQKLAWRIDGGGGIGGGTVSTAGNLVFQVINDGRFRAVTADKGELLYEVQTGRTGMAPPITYEVDGTQYVAFQGGLGRPATTVGPNDAKVDNPPMMFVFALDGKADLPKPAPPPPAPGAAPEL